MDYLNDEFFEGLSKEEIEQLNSELCVSQGAGGGGLQPLERVRGGGGAATPRALERVRGGGGCNP